ncbi:hypothetical protein BS47DRAFT_1368705 [Hydnum rufescens UP504]|uniref:Uncharacterized protein n=1 Tax=Hydnum rufescens UP504 TaxID=1448309 RepID=A0A9P6AF36_9AGAM|nr:hypothetical protein BS47DRAFT_1368705 [Hydnum rufescens UP504]
MPAELELAHWTMSLKLLSYGCDGAHGGCRTAAGWVDGAGASSFERQSLHGHWDGGVVVVVGVEGNRVLGDMGDKNEGKWEDMVSCKPPVAAGETYHELDEKLSGVVVAGVTNQVMPSEDVVRDVLGVIEGDIQVKEAGWEQDIQIESDAQGQQAKEHERWVDSRWR